MDLEQLNVKSYIYSILKEISKKYKYSLLRFYRIEVIKRVENYSIPAILVSKNPFCEDNYYESDIFMKVEVDGSFETCISSTINWFRPNFHSFIFDKDLYNFEKLDGSNIERLKLKIRDVNSDILIFEFEDEEERIRNIIYDEITRVVDILSASTKSKVMNFNLSILGFITLRRNTDVIKCNISKLHDCEIYEI